MNTSITKTASKRSKDPLINFNAPTAFIRNLEALSVHTGVTKAQLLRDAVQALYMDELTAGNIVLE